MPIPDFDADVAVTPIGDGQYQASVHRHWWIMVGPNGGLIIAQLAKAIEVELNDPTRQLRTITVHYLRPPAEGAVDITVEAVRVGRSVAFMRATMSQDGKAIATALAASSPSWDTPFAFNNQPPPQVEPVAATAPRPSGDAMLPPHAANYDTRMLGDYRDGEPQVRAWIRTARPRQIDAVALVAMADALPPPLFAVVDTPMAVPTIELTVHLRASLPLASLTADDHVLMESSSLLLADGFVEEDARIWAPDGTLLAQSRQLALAR